MALSDKPEVNRAKRKALFGRAIVEEHSVYRTVWKNVIYDPRMTSRDYQILADLSFGAPLGGHVDWKNSDSGRVEVTVYYD